MEELGVLIVVLRIGVPSQVRERIYSKSVTVFRCHSVSHRQAKELFAEFKRINGEQITMLCDATWQADPHYFDKE